MRLWNQGCRCPCHTSSSMRPCQMKPSSSALGWCRASEQDYLAGRLCRLDPRPWGVGDNLSSSGLQWCSNCPWCWTGWSKRHHKSNIAVTETNLIYVNLQLDIAKLAKALVLGQVEDLALLEGTLHNTEEQSGHHFFRVQPEPDRLLQLLLIQVVGVPPPPLPYRRHPFSVRQVAGPHL